MKAIFLVRDNPNPPVNGYKKRNYYLIEELKKRIASAAEPALSEANVAPRNDGVILFSTELKKTTFQKIICLILGVFSPVPFSVKIRTDEKIKNDLRMLCLKESPDLIICDAVHRSLNIPFDAAGIKVLYEHNIESEISGRYARLERNIYKKIFACLEYIKFKQLQKKMWLKFDYVIACSELDKKFIQRFASKEKVITVNNGVDLEFFAPGLYPVEPNTLVYTGQIGWHPNEDALVYFTQKIMPIINRSVPNLKLWIVGANPSARIKALANENIIVTGFVDDVRDYVSKAAVFIVPLRIGAGTRLKILEAMSMKKAIVTTTVGCEGLDVENNRHLLVRDNPKDFANAVIELLRDKALRNRLGENGRRLVEEVYDWKVVFKGLDVVLNR